MEKVKLPKEVADALKHARVDLKWEDGNILAKCVRGDWDLESMQILNNFCKKDDNKLTIAKALVIGYEVEQTPEDKVRNYYDECSRSADEGIRNERFGIRNTLNILGIKIEGVNT